MNYVVIFFILCFSICDSSYPIHNMVYEIVDSWDYVFYDKVGKICKDYINDVKISYKDDVPCSNVSKQYITVGCTSINYSKTLALKESSIVLRNDMEDNIRELVLGHEFTHILAICVHGRLDGDMYHTNPNYWVCPHSVEYDVANKVGIKMDKRLNVNFSSKCR